MNIALILSGGTGTRMGVDVPKQYMEVAGRPIFTYCVESLLSHDRIDAVQVVADPLWQKEILGWYRRRTAQKAGVDADREAGQGRETDNILWEKKFRGFSAPGETRQLSIYHGLEDIMEYADDTDYVFIHDAARPLLSAEIIADCLDGALDHDGAMPVLPMKDTLYYSRSGNVVDRLLDRSTIYAGQAPEVFLLGRYYEANRSLLPDRIWEINGSTEPAVLAGMDIAMIPGDEKNFKITTMADLERFWSIIDK